MIEMVSWAIIVRATAVVPPLWLVTLVYFFEIYLMDLINILLDEIFGLLGSKMNFLDQVLCDLDLRFILRF